MNRRQLRRVLLTLFVAAGVLGTFGIVHKARAPIVPAIVTRNMDSHRAVSGNLDARIDRFLHDRPAADRSRSPRVVALTFDDGPYAVETPLLLSVLHDLDVRATFFLIGRDAEEFPELTQRIAADGHEIANHTLTHPNLDQLSPAAVRAELSLGAGVLDRYARDPAIHTMMRPPHGRFTEETIRVAQQAGYHVILWSDDPGDWRSVTPQTLIQHVAAHATAPDIILLHSGRLATIVMLPELIARFRRAGFHFVTVGELMRDVPTSVIDHPAKRPV